MDIRDRIVEFKRLPSTEILDHEGNIHKHPAAQKNAMAGVLQEIGIADVLVTYSSERRGGKLVVIDGHLRKNEFDAEWPCVITDLTDDEADKLLLSHDAVGRMAIVEEREFNALRNSTEFADKSIEIMLDSIALDKFGGKKKREKRREDEEAVDEPEENPVPGMDLEPYEHYDYLLILATNVMDWNWLLERLDIEHVNGSVDQKYQRVGLGRAINANKLIEALREGDEAINELKRNRRKQTRKKAPNGDAPTVQDRGSQPAPDGADAPDPPPSA